MLFVKQIHWFYIFYQHAHVLNNFLTVYAITKEANIAENKTRVNG